MSDAEKERNTIPQDEASRCRCIKSQSGTNKTSRNAPYFENVAAKIAERRCDLIGRHNSLREKITAMERSIPALMAYNMWTASKRCEDGPYCKIREIMKRIVPQPDPAEELLEKIKKNVEELNKQTAELHDKIIDADVKLEETGMELESLELSNKEMGEKLNGLEKEVKNCTTPSLHSIHSEDLICLTRIRQLAEEEITLKNYIKELQRREAVFREQMERLLTSKEFRTCGKDMIKRMRELERSQCPFRSHRHTGRLKKRSKESEQDSPEISIKHDSKKEEKVVKGKNANGKESSWVFNWWKKQQEITGANNAVTSTDAEGIPDEYKSCVCSSSTTVLCYGKLSNKKSISKSSKHRKSATKSMPCHPRPCCVPFEKGLDAHATSELCNCKKSIIDSSILKSRCSKSPLCQPPPCVISKGDPRRSLKKSTPCKEHLHPRQIGGCRCNCKGKCASGLSSISCNCSIAPVYPGDKGYQPVAAKSLVSEQKENNNSDEEFCECCSCGCADSDVS